MSESGSEGMGHAGAERLRSRRFDEAAASVEAALNELRQAEQTLERQLADLRCYIRAHAAPAHPH